MRSAPSDAHATLYLRESEMAARLRAFDWAATSLGPIERWPHSFRVAVGICLNSRFPMRISWGADGLILYNDAYAPILGQRHPWAFGRPAREVWAEVWETVGPQMAAVMERGEATWNERTHLVFERNGYPEDVWLTFSYSPIPDDEGGIAGLFCVVTEDTAEVLAERERDRSQARWRLALASADMGWWRVDPATFEVAWDSRLAEIFDLPGYRTGLGDILESRLHPSDRPAVAEAIARALDPAHPQPYTIEYRVVHRDGAVRWVLANGKAAFEGEGSARRAVDFAGTVTDITDRKAAEEALREGAERLRLAATAAGVGYWTWDPRTGEVTPDDVCASLFGLTPAEGRRFENVVGRVHPNDRPLLVSTLERALRGEASYDLEFRVVHPDGTVRWLTGRGDVTRDEAGQPVRMSGINLDVTDRRRTADTAARSLARLRAVVESMHEGLVIVDVATGRMEWNAAALAMCGFSSVAEAEQIRASELASFEISSLDGRIVDRADYPLSRVRRGEVLVNEEFHVRRRDVHVDRVIAYSGTPVHDAEGRLTLAVLTLHDVTERRRMELELAASEARFRQLANAMPLVVWTAEPDGTVDWFNDRWYELTGTPPGLIRDDNVGLVMDPDDFRRMRDSWGRAVRDGVPFEIEYRFREGATGQYRWYLGRALPVREEGGAIVKWYGSAVDIHERKEATFRREELLEVERAARVEAERVARLKDEFLATLSHELRTPLNAILGWSQLIARGRVTGEEAAKGLAVIERNARAQAQLIEDMLDMSRIAAGKLQLTPEPTALADVVDAALQTVRPAADAKGIALVREVDPDAGPVLADPHRMQQVVWNLLTNAVKFTPQGGTVRVALRRSGGAVEVVVSDTGRGIPVAFVPYVFERFRQADSGTTREHGGLGLGLAIVKHLVEAHGGTVGVHSDGPGTGTSFTVRLPLLQPRSPAPAEPARQEKLPSLAGVRVLVVDDEADARDLVRRILGEQGAEVAVAGSAREALGLLRSDRFAVLVSDIGMPEEDGFALIRAVRALEGPGAAGLPAVALTAFVRTEDRARVLEAGYQSHLAKPVDAAALHAVVAQLSHPEPRIP